MKAHEDRQVTVEEFIQARKDNEARKEGRLACAYSGTCEDSVESNPQTSSEYVTLAMRLERRGASQVSIQRPLRMQLNLSPRWHF